MKKNIGKFSLYWPLVFVEAYLIATLLLYEFGPIDWQTENKSMFWMFLALYHVAFIVGYIFSIRKIKLNETAWNPTRIDPKVYRWIIWGIIGISVVCACIEYRNTTYADSYIPFDLPKNFLKGLLDPAERYYGKGDGEYTANKLVTILSSLFSFIYVSLIPLLVVEWKRISIPQRICLMAIILFKVVVFVSVGTNKGIFDTAFGFVGILLILVVLNLIHRTNEHIDKKTFAIVAAFALFLSLFSVTYFTVNMFTRSGVKMPEILSSLVPQQTEPHIETQAPTETPTQATTPSATQETTPPATQGTTPPATQGTTPPATQETKPPAKQETKPKNSFVGRMIRSGTSYLTQGYYGFSLALDEDFTTTYGIGSSQFLRSNFKSLFGINVDERTYQHKITDVWHETGKWHSFYSYVANDVSFYGVIVVMLLLGMYYGSICKDVILNNSFVGKMILPLFVILFVYMPANNQVFSVMGTFMAFFELFFLWVLSKIPWKKGITHGK